MPLMYVPRFDKCRIVKDGYLVDVKIVTQARNLYRVPSVTFG